MLSRAKSVARRIADRVRQVSGDTKADHPTLPADPTDEAPPVG